MKIDVIDEIEGCRGLRPKSFYFKTKNRKLKHGKGQKKIYETSLSFCEEKNVKKQRPREKIVTVLERESWPGLFGKSPRALSISGKTKS